MIRYLRDAVDARDEQGYSSKQYHGLALRRQKGRGVLFLHPPAYTFSKVLHGIQSWFLPSFTVWGPLFAAWRVRKSAVKWPSYVVNDQKCTLKTTRQYASFLRQWKRKNGYRYCTVVSHFSPSPPPPHVENQVDGPPLKT